MDYHYHLHMSAPKLTLLRPSFTFYHLHTSVPKLILLCPTFTFYHLHTSVPKLTLLCPTFTFYHSHASVPKLTLPRPSFTFYHLHASVPKLTLLCPTFTFYHLHASVPKLTLLCPSFTFYHSHASVPPTLLQPRAKSHVSTWCKLNFRLHGYLHAVGFRSAGDVILLSFWEAALRNLGKTVAGVTCMQLVVVVTVMSSCLLLGQHLKLKGSPKRSM